MIKTDNRKNSIKEYEQGLYSNPKKKLQYVIVNEAGASAPRRKLATEGRISVGDAALRDARKSFRIRSSSLKSILVLSGWAVPTIWIRRD